MLQCKIPKLFGHTYSKLKTSKGPFASGKEPLRKLAPCLPTAGFGKFPDAYAAGNGNKRIESEPTTA
jgi:hypothetical protein